jgi:hypothetical protein
MDPNPTFESEPFMVHLQMKLNKTQFQNNASIIVLHYHSQTIAVDNFIGLDIVDMSCVVFNSYLVQQSIIVSNALDTN